jgi:hypothetical protein
MEVMYHEQSEIV